MDIVSVSSFFRALSVQLIKNVFIIFMEEFCLLRMNFEEACKEMIRAIDFNDNCKEGVIYVKDISLFPLKLFKASKNASKYTLKIFKDAADLFLDISEYVDNECKSIYFLILFEDLRVHTMALKLFKAVCDILVNGLQCTVVLVNSKGKLRKICTT